MLKISQKQAGERYDTLPENIREALFSENSVNAVWRFGETNHLSEEKIEEVATVAGDVLMGFLRSDINEVAQEIQERTNVPKPLALDIAKELDKKIFSQIKNDLDRIYAPIDSSRIKISPEKIAGTERTIPTPQVIKPSALNLDTFRSKPSFEIKVPDYKNAKPIESSALNKTELPSMNDIKSPSINEAKMPQTSKTEDLSVSGPEAPEKNEIEQPLPSEVRPFLLHEEKPLFSYETPPENPSVSFESGRRRLFSKKPIVAKIETPEKEKSKKQEARVVHYSNLRTPLDANNN